MNIVSRDKWCDAVNFLMGVGTFPTLSAKDQRFLMSMLRGPFAKGMTNEQAQRVLLASGWDTEPTSREDIERNI
jgi:hypothetical protein